MARQSRPNLGQMMRYDDALKAVGGNRPYHEAVMVMTKQDRRVSPPPAL